MKQLNWYQIFGNAHTIPDGRTVTPTDDIQIWLNCANVWDKTYTTLAEVLADTDTLLALINSPNAVDYMVRSTTWAVGSVPNMTSATTPSGKVTASSQPNSNRPAWKAFNGTMAGGNEAWECYNGSSDHSDWIDYEFTEPRIVTKFEYYLGSNRSCTYRIQGSNDGVIYENIKVFSNVTLVNATDTLVTFENNTAYKHYRIYFDSMPYYGSSLYYLVGSFNLYYPCVVSDSTAMSYIGLNNYCANTLLNNGGVNTFVKYPYYETTKTYNGVTFTVSEDGSINVNGTASANSRFYIVSGNIGNFSQYFTEAGTYKLDLGTSDFNSNYTAFFGIQYNGTWVVGHWFDDSQPYEFTVTEAMINNSSDYFVQYYILVNNGTTVTNKVVRPFPVWTYAICNSEYFESVLNVKVPAMTSNTSPEGICTSVNSLGSGSAYNVFDRNSSTSAQPNQYPCIIGYTFTATKKIYMAVAEFSEAGRIPGNFKIQYAESSSLTPSTDIKTISSPSLITKVVFDSAVEKASFCFNSSSNGTLGWLRVKNLQFYGREDV